MCLLLETIKVKNKQLQSLDFHNERLNRTRKELFGTSKPLLLEEMMQIPDNLGDGVFKCRVLYRNEIEKIEFQPYQIKEIRSLKIVENAQISYAYKFADRQNIEKLHANLLSLNTQDILITKNGLVTDTSYANIVFFDREKYFTPESPLLEGTKRAQLLQKQLITERKIRVQDIQHFQFAKLINAMIDLEESPIIPISDII
jgi:4-amino-4-deoxychorismate lyase